MARAEKRKEGLPPGRNTQGVNLGVELGVAQLIQFR